MEAARTAALLGRPVRLVERSAQLGGMLRIAAALPGRERFGLLVEWWERELARLGVEVCLRTEAGAGDLGGDVVLATGSVTSAPSFAIGEGVVVLAAAEFAEVSRVSGPDSPRLGSRLAGLGDATRRWPAPDSRVVSSRLAGSRIPTRGGGACSPRGVAVVVHDPVGDWTGVAVAELLAAAGTTCALVTPDAVAGTQLARTGDLADANARLERAGVQRVLFSRLRSVGGGRAVVEDVHHGATRTLPADLVVDCAHRLPDLTLGGHPRIGDCLAPRTVHEAVREARQAVRC
jgi:hypothetical protein